MVFFALSGPRARKSPKILQIPLTRTFVRVTLYLEQKFEKEECVMTGWTFFFVLVGVTSLTSQLFRIVDAIERPARRAPLR